MLQLVNIPEAFLQFNAGNFVVSKASRPFSSIDQAHEQNNALVEGDGGAVGLTQNPQALLRWMTAGPEVARALNKFKDNCLKKEKENELLHHESTNSAQASFAKNVRQLVSVFEEMGNPFLEESGDLIAIDSINIADTDVSHTVRSIEKIGQ